MAIINKSTKNMLVRMWKKGNPFALQWECRLVQPLWRAVWSYLKKLKMELLHDPAIPLLGIYPKKPETLIWRNICTPVSIAALLTIANIQQQPRYSSVNKWLKMLWCIYTMEYYLVVKKRKPYPLPQYGWTVLSERALC